MQDAQYYKCSSCNYEFLAETETATCPRCKSDKLENKDIKDIASIDE